MKKISKNKLFFLGVGLLAGFLTTLLFPRTHSLNTRSEVLLLGNSTSVASSLELGVVLPESLNSFSPMAGLYSRLGATGKVDFVALAAEILALSEDSPHRLSAFDLLFDRWAQENPTEALEFAGTLQGGMREEAFRATLLRLGSEGFEETLAWMNEYMDYSARDDIQMWLYVGLAQSNPVLAMAEIAKLEDGKIKESALVNVVSVWAKVDVLAAFDWYETASWNGEMAGIYERLIGAYLTQDPEGARYLIEQMDESYVRDKYQLELVTMMAESDVNFALEVSEAIVEPIQRETAFTYAFEVWAQQNPEAALEKAIEISADGTMEKSTINSIFRQSAFALLWQDTDKLRESYTQLPKDIREEIVSPFVQEWMMEEPVAAAAWAAQFPSDSVEYNLGISGVVFHYKNWDPEEGIRYAQAITYTDIKNDNVYSSLKSLYRKDPARAIEVAADSNLVNREVQEGFTNWIEETGKTSMIFYLPGK